MLNKILSPLAELSFALLRIVAGALFAYHGAAKLFGFFGNFMPKPGELAWFGGIIELVGGVLVALGLFSRCAAFVCSGQMAVAYFKFHMGNPPHGQDAASTPQWALDVFPTANGGELAVLYCFLFLYVACRGAGRLSVDGRCCRPSEPPTPPPAR